MRPREALAMLRVARPPAPYGGRPAGPLPQHRGRSPGRPAAAAAGRPGSVSCGTGRSWPRPCSGPGHG